MSPVLFAQNPYRKLYFYVNYQILKTITIINCYFRLLSQETLIQLARIIILPNFKMIAIFDETNVQEQKK